MSWMVSGNKKGQRLTMCEHNLVSSNVVLSFNTARTLPPEGGSHEPASRERANPETMMQSPTRT